MNDVLEDIPFRTRVEQSEDGVCVVHAAGEVDLHAASELDRHLRRCENYGPRAVVVNLSEATILDSTALGVLVAGHGRLAKKGIALKLVCSDRLIRRVLRITGLDRVFEVYATWAEAMDGGVSLKDMKGGAELDPVHGKPGAASES